jgi:hypothetical protein
MSLSPIKVTPKNSPFKGTDHRYRGVLASSSWCLCVGAGISTGLVPTWEELSRRIVNEAFSTWYDMASFRSVIQETRWGLDALLQGAASRLLLNGKSLEDFENLLEQALYSDLLKIAKKAKVEAALVEALNDPRWLKNGPLHDLCSFFEAEYADCTLIQLTRELARANGSGKGPESIINFNADTLLYALLDLFLIREYRARTGKIENPPASFVKSFRGGEAKGRLATPIFHCHGAIAPASRKSKSSRRRDSRDQLIFREQEYLDLAGSISTWAQSLFLFHAQSSRLLIVGHSLADPNIRKWLGWTHANSVKTFSVVSSANEISPRHIWVAKSPVDPKVREIQEVSLLHLGVRVCWLDDWIDIAPALRNLLAI